MRNIGCVEDTLEQGEGSVDVECDRDGVVWVGVVDDLDAVLDILEGNVEEVLVEIQEASEQENFVKAWGATLPVIFVSMIRVSKGRSTYLRTMSVILWYVSSTGKGEPL